MKFQNEGQLCPPFLSKYHRDAQTVLATKYIKVAVKKVAISNGFKTNGT